MDCKVCEGLGDGPFVECPVCGRMVSVHYFGKLQMMREKYGTRNLLELSREKLEFGEIAAILIFIERADRHQGDASTSMRCRSDGTYENLKKRLDEIRGENLIQ